MLGFRARIDELVAIVLRVSETDYFPISVASFDDEELASYQRPGLTTARLPYDVMGRSGVEMVLGGRPLEHQLVPMPIIVRDSIRTIEGSS